MSKLDKLHTETLSDICKTGIYTITSNINKKMYVGLATKVSSYNKFSNGFSHRWNGHVWAFTNNRHKNIYMQRHVNKYGINDLKFEILDICEPEFCASAELYWIRMLDTVKYGFNAIYDSHHRLGKNSASYKSFDEDALIKDYLTNKCSILYLSTKYNINVKKISNFLKNKNIEIIDTTKLKYKINVNSVYDYYLNSNHSLTSLAQELNIPKASLLKIFKTNNFKYKIEIVNSHIMFIYDRYIQGESLEKIGIDYKVCATTLRKLFTNHNLKKIH